MPEGNMTVRDRYLEQMVESASQEGLLLMLVDGAVNFIRRAHLALEKERLDEVHNFLVKAQNIYVELVISLDLDSGEFADNLALVYQYLYNILIEANIEKNGEKISQALRLAEEVRDLWRETVEKARAEGPDEAPAPEVAPLPESKEIAPTGRVYEPVGGMKTIKSRPPDEEPPSRLNITG